MVAFIASLPYLFQLMLKFMTVMEKFATWAEANQLDKWFDKVEGAIDELEAAKTPEEKRSAARNLGSVIGGL